MGPLCAWSLCQPVRGYIDRWGGMQQICARWKRYMWAFVHVVYDHVGEAHWGDNALCDDGCPSTNLLLHSNEHIRMTSECRFSVLAYVCQLYCNVLSSMAGLNNPKDLREWIKQWVMQGLFLFIYHCMKCWMPCWGVLVDLDWMLVLAVCVCLCILWVGVLLYLWSFQTQSINTFLIQSCYRNFTGLFKLPRWH